MNERFVESRDALSYARQALKNGDMTEARQWAERAAQLAPQSEDPWLVLAAVASPRESMEYIRRALEANPQSPRAKKGMEWALQRLGETPKGEAHSGKGEQAKGRADAKPKKKSKTGRLLPILLVVVGLAAFLFAFWWSAVNSPVLASIINSIAPKAEQPVHSQSFAQVDIAKPAPATTTSQPMVQVLPTATIAPASTSQPEIANISPTETQVVQAVIVPADTPKVETAVVPADTSVPPTNPPAVEPTATQPEATSIPGVVLAEIVPDTPTPEYTAPTAVVFVPPSTTGSGHWIDVDLSQQRVYAYDGDTLVNSFVVSTGTWQTPTVTGQFHVWIKLRSTAMSGPGYYLPDVPYTMYFYKGYGLHGTYWHNNFGTPMSHGCVNLTIPDAEWLYNFSTVGTLVNVHY
jgi:lipoprotein-anchoring transpeptidase ErfK/SrfK